VKWNVADLARLFPLLGVLQNDTAPMIIDNPPLFDLLQGSKAAEAGKTIVQAAISYARGLSGAVDITHWRNAQLRGSEFDHTGEGESGQRVTRTAHALSITAPCGA
jgi:hypothetical protein